VPGTEISFQKISDIRTRPKTAVGSLFDSEKTGHPWMVQAVAPLLEQL